MLAGVARFLNLGFGTEAFWSVWNSDLQPDIFAAYIEEKAETNQYQSNLLKAIFWIGNILSDFGTGVLRALGAKSIEKSLGYMHMYPDWKEQNQLERKKEIEITSEKFALGA